MNGRRVGRWAVAGIVSGVAHGGALLALALSVAPEPMEKQPAPKSRLDIQSQKVNRSAAQEQHAQADAAQESIAQTARVGQGVVRQSKAVAVAVSGDGIAAKPARGQSIAAGKTNAAVSKPAAAKGEPLVVAALPAQKAAQPDLPHQSIQQSSAITDVVPVSAPLMEAMSPVVAPQRASVEAKVNGTAVSSSALGAIADNAAAVALPSQKGTAALAWATEGDVADPVSLAAIQSFMQPGDLAQGTDRVRDGIAGVLAAVPCARLQTTFVPETGELRLSGHIPESGMRGPVLAALKQQVGGAIPISDELLILPRPQCGALTGIANVGLAQSTEQLTNPRVVGEGGFARNFTYSEGQRLTLELTAADYDGYVYVDFFTADGNVIHLQPNEIVPLEFAPAKSALTVGKDRGDKPSLELTVTPPFGQEIAAAFAASVPLYEGLRPIQEPAAPYLAFLAERVTATRAANVDFKGEWVYFFISTKAR